MAIATEAGLLYAKGGNRPMLDSTLNNIGRALYRSGDLSEAKKAFAERVENDRALGSGLRLSFGLLCLAEVLTDEAHLNEAQSKLQEALALVVESGSRDDTYQCLIAAHLAEVRRMLGDLAGARRLCEESLARLSAGDPRSSYEERADLLIQLGAVLLAQGDIAAAHGRIEEAVALSRWAKGRRGHVDGGHRRALAEIALAEGHPAEAEELARQSVERFASSKAMIGGSHARAVLALALLRQGRRAEAQAVIDRARELLGKGEDVPVRLAVSIAAARVRAAAERPAEAAAARHDLDAILAEATRTGLVGQALEARLALGEIEIQSGPRATGRARLRALTKDAAVGGFGLIARRAMALLR